MMIDNHKKHSLFKRIKLWFTDPYYYNVVIHNGYGFITPCKYSIHHVVIEIYESYGFFIKTFDNKEEAIEYKTYMESAIKILS